MIEIVPARLLHIGPIATRMREADRIECAALGRTPKDGLRIGLRTSLAPLTVLVEGRPEAMLGIVPGSLLKGSGTAWMLATDAIDHQRRALVAFGRDVLAWLAADFREVGNIVAADNERAIRFLRFLGFCVGGPAQVHGGVAFLRFGMAEHAVACPEGLSSGLRQVGRVDGRKRRTAVPGARGVIPAGAAPHEKYLFSPFWQ